MDCWYIQTFRRDTLPPSSGLKCFSLPPHTHQFFNYLSSYKASFPTSTYPFTQLPWRRSNRWPVSSAVCCQLSRHLPLLFISRHHIAVCCTINFTLCSFLSTFPSLHLSVPQFNDSITYCMLRMTFMLDNYVHFLVPLLISHLFHGSSTE